MKKYRGTTRERLRAAGYATAFSLNEMTEGEYDIILLDRYDRHAEIVKVMKKLRPTTPEEQIRMAVAMAPSALFENVTGEEADRIKAKLFKAGGLWEIQENSGRVCVCEGSPKPENN